MRALRPPATSALHAKHTQEYAAEAEPHEADVRIYQSAARLSAFGALAQGGSLRSSSPVTQAHRLLLETRLRGDPGGRVAW